jgi:formylglycine-generating enzyme required for sulfatase activity
MADLFISYKSERRNAAQHLSRILELNGYSVWFDYGLLSGTDFGRQIEREIRSAKAVIVLWCSLSRESAWVLEEAHLAQRLGTLTPVWLERVDPPLGFARAETVDLSVWDGAPRSHGLDRLLTEISRRIGRDPVPQFRGLLAYEETWRSFGAPSLARFTLTAPPAIERERLGSDKRVREMEASTAPLSPSSFDPATRWRAEGRVKVEAKFVHNAPDGWFQPGGGKAEWFKDLDVGPEMVVVPFGSFTMGSQKSEYGRGEDEGPQRSATFVDPFAVGRFAVTFAEWDAYTAEERPSVFRNFFGVSKIPPDKRRGALPVVDVSWDRAKAYVAWLCYKSGKPYRLLSEAEWEYVARAGTTTAFWWGNSIAPEQANYDRNYTYGDGAKGSYLQRTVAVNSFLPNAWGLYQVHGNVWEWTEDCYHDSYIGAPSRGQAWTGGDDSRRVIRGGSWFNAPDLLRCAARLADVAEKQVSNIGFRVARTLVVR